MRYRNLTNYQDIYSCYWGAFEVTDRNRPEQQVIDNRNSFIIDYDIKQYKSCPPTYIDKLSRYNEFGVDLFVFDHREHYINNKSQYVILVSVPPTTIEDFNYTENGWIEIYPMYSLYHKTYMKVVNMKYQKRR
jgi:hypothetical protein